MPDISMCGDRACPSAALCDRSPMSGQEPNFRQSWGSFQRGDRAACRHLVPADAQAEVVLIERGVIEPA